MWLLQLYSVVVASFSICRKSAEDVSIKSKHRFVLIRLWVAWVDSIVFLVCLIELKASGAEFIFAGFRFNHLIIV